MLFRSRRIAAGGKPFRLGKGEDPHVSRIGEEVVSETTDPRENLPIRYAVNHPDSQARHHAREYKKALTAYNAGHAKLASDHRSPTREQEDELMNHYEVAQYHHGKYKNRLQQINIKSPFHRKEELMDEATDNKPHPKGTRVIVTHKGHQKPGRVIRHDPGGPDSSPFYIVDVGEYGSGKFMAHQVKKEDLQEL